MFSDPDYYIVPICSLKNKNIVSQRFFFQQPMTFARANCWTNELFVWKKESCIKKPPGTPRQGSRDQIIWCASKACAMSSSKNGELVPVASDIGTYSWWTVVSLASVHATCIVDLDFFCWKKTPYILLALHLHCFNNTRTGPSAIMFVNDIADDD